MTYPFSYDKIKEVFEELNDRGLLKKDFFKPKDEDFQIDYLESKSVCVEKRKALKEAKKSKKKNPNLDIEEVEKDYEDAATTLQEATDQLLVDLSEIINCRSFHLNFETGQDPNHGNDPNRKVYKAKDRYTVIASRLINKEIRNVYKTETPDRNAIVRDLVAYLREPIPKIIIRADIKSFFESISFKHLLDKMEEDGYVSRKSMKLLRNTAYRMKEELNSDFVPIPRGMSFTSSLSEFYLRDIDRSIRNLKGVYFYRRYVDDIIVLANPSDYASPKALFQSLQTIVEKENYGVIGLHLHTPEDHDNKYKAVVARYGGSKVIDFNYLGYNIKVGGKDSTVSLRLTDSKMSDYKDILDKVLKYYADHALCNPKHKRSAKRLLYLVLKYLTKNYRLGGSKHEIISGIYFNHKNITDFSSLEELDSYMYSKTDEYVSEEHIKHKMPIDGNYVEAIRTNIKEHYSFIRGFCERQMCKMSSAKIHQIKGFLVWLQRIGN